MGWTVDGLDYTTRRKITIAASLIDADLTDFPLLVKLSAGNFDFSKANSDGFDIRFTSANGTTLLKYERVRHDSDGSVAEYWVKVPAVDSDVDTDIYMYYRTADTADGADPANVWDSDYKAVYHLNGAYNGSANEVLDSTGNNRHGVATGPPDQADGKISKCQNFNGSSDYIAFPNITEFGYQADWTIDLLYTDDGAGGVSYRTLYNRAGNCEMRHNASGSGTEIQQYNFNGKNPLITAANIATATWYHLAFTWDWLGANGNGKIYLNGVQKDNTDADTFGGAFNAAFYLGRAQHVAGRWWDGKVEELRVSSIKRAVEWLKATYNACFDLLNTYGNEEAPPALNIRSHCVII